MTDQIIATDVLIAAKSAIKNYSLAITETATSEVRLTLIKQLEDAIEFHKTISSFMIDKGYYNPYDTNKQLQVDMNFVDQAIKLAND